jgi:hypothetical protein
MQYEYFSNQTPALGQDRKREEKRGVAQVFFLSSRNGLAVIFNFLQRAVSSPHSVGDKGDHGIASNTYTLCQAERLEYNFIKTNSLRRIAVNES